MRNIWRGWDHMVYHTCTAMKHVCVHIYYSPNIPDMKRHTQKKKSVFIFIEVKLSFSYGSLCFLADAGSSMTFTSKHHFWPVLHDSFLPNQSFHLCLMLFSISFCTDCNIFFSVVFCISLLNSDIRLSFLPFCICVFSCI